MLQLQRRESINSRTQNSSAQNKGRLGYAAEKSHSIDDEALYFKLWELARLASLTTSNEKQKIEEVIKELEKLLSNQKLKFSSLPNSPKLSSNDKTIMFLYKALSAIVIPEISWIDWWQKDLDQLSSFSDGENSLKHKICSLQRKVLQSSRSSPLILKNIEGNIINGIAYFLEDYTSNLSPSRANIVRWLLLDSGAPWPSYFTQYSLKLVKIIEELLSQEDTLSEDRSKYDIFQNKLIKDVKSYLYQDESIPYSRYKNLARLYLIAHNKDKSIIHYSTLMTIFSTISNGEPLG